MRQLTPIQKLYVRFRRWMIEQTKETEESFVKTARILFPEIKGHQELKGAFEDWQDSIGQPNEPQAREAFVRIARREMTNLIQFNPTSLERPSIWPGVRRNVSDLYGEMSFLVFTTQADIDGAISDLLDIGYSQKELWDTLQELKNEEPVDSAYAEDWEAAMVRRGFGRPEMLRPNAPESDDLADFWMTNIAAMRPNAAIASERMVGSEWAQAVAAGQTQELREVEGAKLQAEIEKEAKAHPSLPRSVIEVIARDHLKYEKNPMGTSLERSGGWE